MTQLLESLLGELGFSAKEAIVYETLLRRGPSSVRLLAVATGINRGTVHEILKELIAKGLVSYYEKSKRQYFIAESPENLREIVRGKQQKLQHTERSLEQALPELTALVATDSDKAVTRFYEGAKGVRVILHD